MREPDFWYGPPSTLSALLSPIAAIYGFITQRRMARVGMRVGIPVICIGNYHLGGAGKTPTTLAIANILRGMGETPFVVSRGFGGELPGPVRVDATHRASDVGDEPLMMAAHMPVIVSRDRVAGALLAKGQDASVILLDDGFQNPALVKDVSLIVIDGTRAIGNARVFPAGPLRAPLASQLARTDAMIVIGEGRAADAVMKDVAAQGGFVTRAAFDPDRDSLSRLAGKRVLAFAGIGDPARFFATLRGSGTEVVKEKPFADHYRFTAADIERLVAEAAAGLLALVTTEKDMARIVSDPALAVLSKDIVPFAATLKIDSEVDLRGFLQQRLADARASL